MGRWVDTPVTVKIINEEGARWMMSVVFRTAISQKSAQIRSERHAYKHISVATITGVTLKEGPSTLLGWSFPGGNL